MVMLCFVGNFEVGGKVTNFVTAATRDLHMTKTESHIELCISSSAILLTFANSDNVQKICLGCTDEDL